MQTTWKSRWTTPAEAKAVAERLTSQMSGGALHKAFDHLSNELLSSLGYSDFVGAFIAATEGYHTPTKEPNHERL